MKNFLMNLKFLWTATQKNKNNFGLKDKDIKILRDIFKKYSVSHVYIFGSRARGDYKPYSDIDFAIKDKLSQAKKAQLSLDLRECKIPYIIDLIFFDELQSNKLKEEISKEGILFKL